MEFSCTLHRGDGYLLVNIAGSPSSFEVWLGAAKDFSAQASGLGYDRLLVNEVRLSVSMEMHEQMIAYQRDTNIFGQNGIVRFAVYCAGHSLSLYKHYERLTECSNWPDTKVFEDVEAAEKWLLS